jgi:hypothetical protein
LEMFLPNLSRFSPSTELLVALNERIAVFGLYLLAFGVWLGPALSSVGAGLVILMFTVRARAWRWAIADRIFWICATGIIYIMVRSWMAASEMPEAAEMQWKHGLAWIQLLMFIPVAWIIALVPARLRTAAVLAAGGMLVGTVMAFEATTLSEISSVGRFGGYLDRPVVYAFYVSIVLLGITVWGGAIFSAEGPAPAWVRRTAAGLMWATVILLVWAFFASKSRGPLLALLLVLPIALVWRYGAAATKMGGHRRPIILGLFLATILVAGLSAGPVLERVRTDGGAAWAALKEGLDEVPLTASTLRLHMWRYAIRRWSERPMLGWGPGSVEPILAA